MVKMTLDFRFQTSVFQFHAHKALDSGSLGMDNDAQLVGLTVELRVSNAEDTAYSGDHVNG